MGCPFDVLDDALLLHIIRRLDPKPDVFQLARTCHRFHQLGRDKRNWLQVLPASMSAPAAVMVAGSHASPARFHSFMHAVQASRPGDTILLARGQHQLVGTVVVDKCLSIVGLGRAEDTLLCCNTKAEPVLDIRATCKITNISMRSHCAPCVTHCAGQLHLDHCHLTCDSHGLEHLCAPILTSASLSASARSTTITTSSEAPHSSAATPCMATASSHITAGAQLGVSDTAGTHGAIPAHSSAVKANSGVVAAGKTRTDGVGRLTVTECLLEGGSRAVVCCGTGQLQGVRAIYQSHRTLFYLDVDCRVPGTIGPIHETATAAAQQQQEQQQHRVHGKPELNTDKNVSASSKPVAGSNGIQEAGVLLQAGKQLNRQQQIMQQQQQQQQQQQLTGLAALAQLGGMLASASDAQGVLEMHFSVGHTARASKQGACGSIHSGDGREAGGSVIMLCEPEEPGAGAAAHGWVGHQPESNGRQLGGGGLFLDDVSQSGTCAVCGLSSHCMCAMLETSRGNEKRRRV